MGIITNYVFLEILIVLLVNFVGSCLEKLYLNFNNFLTFQARRGSEEHDAMYTLLRRIKKRRQGIRKPIDQRDVICEPQLGAVHE